MVVTRRTIFELRKARDRAHILEALAIALWPASTRSVVRARRHTAEAKAALIFIRGDGQRRCDAGARRDDAAQRPEWLSQKFGVRDGQYYLTEQQAQAILDLRLRS